MGGDTTVPQYQATARVPVQQIVKSSMQMLTLHGTWFIEQNFYKLTTSQVVVNNNTIMIGRNL